MSRILRTALALAAVLSMAGAYVAGRHVAHALAGCHLARLERAQTQIDMNESAYKAFQKEDAKLNALYVKLLHSYNPKDADEDKTYKKIVAAEKAWITYRDAQADMDASMEAEGGSVYPTVFSNACASLTDERIKSINAELKVINSR